MKTKTSLILITSLTATFVALCAAIFSVTGIAKLFAGAAISSAIMAAALELGKIVSISFLYQYWESIPKLLKRYLTVASVVLMLITSAGIYGYLTAAYAKVSSEPMKLNASSQIANTKLKSVTEEIDRKNIRLNQLISIKTQQENRLDSLLLRRASSSTVRAVQANINDADKNVIALQSDIETLSLRRDSLETLKIENTVKINSDSDIGTFLYLAKLLNVPLETIVKWFILVIVLVFDPLAVALIIAVNFLIKTDDKTPEVIEISEPPVETEKEDDIEYVTAHIETEEPQIVSTDYRSVSFDWNNVDNWKNNPEAVKYYNRYLKHKIEG